MLIYKITNKINGKIYIGQTTRTLKERWADYIKEYKYIKEDSKNLRLIIKAFRKYGIDNFEITILEDSIETLEELNNKERDYILKYNCTDKTIGYNIEFEVMVLESILKNRKEKYQKLNQVRKIICGELKGS